MITKAQKVRLAVFLIIGFFILIMILALLLGSKLSEKRDFYKISYDDTSVAGLQIGGAVLYRGIRIGRVEDIEIDKKNITNIIVTISIKAQTPIKADQEAKLVIVGITGLKQIELSGGTNESPYLKPGDMIPAGRSLFDNLSDTAEVLTMKIEIIMDNLIAITNPNNQEKLSNILTNVDNIIAESRTPIKQSFENIDELTAELTIASINLNHIMSELNKTIDFNKIGKIVDNAEQISNNLAQIDIPEIEKSVLLTINNLNEAINKTNMILFRVDGVIQRNSPDINATIEELRETVENLSEFVRLLNEDPSILWRSRTTGN
ncbi:MAG: MlaD family protein [Candidatus Cloacimonetes bacterium]|nr:MlaD family protein [Candidatus Cloacimonadota bacterium]MDD4155043.1 MlaD family protein [Candidatus Cloacimonadota bacterium]